MHVVRLCSHARPVDAEWRVAQENDEASSGISGHVATSPPWPARATTVPATTGSAPPASPSPRTPGAGLSRDELAEAVNTWLAEHTGRAGALDGQAVGRWERGAVRCPNREYRTALRSLLDATDEELGFADRAPAPATALAGFDPEGVLDTEAHERVATVSRWPRRIDRSALEAIAAVLTSVRHLEDETSAAEVAPHVRAHAALIDSTSTERSRSRTKPVIRNG